MQYQFKDLLLEDLSWWVEDYPDRVQRIIAEPQQEVRFEPYPLRKQVDFGVIDCHRIIIAYQLDYFGKLGCAEREYKATTDIVVEEKFETKAERDQRGLQIMQERKCHLSTPDEFTLKYVRGKGFLVADLVQHIYSFYANEMENDELTWMGNRWWFEGLKFVSCEQVTKSDGTIEHVPIYELWLGS